jgi:hypothetical protein
MHWEDIIGTNIDTLEYKTKKCSVGCRVDKALDFFREVLGSNLGCCTGYPNRGSSFYSVLHGKLLDITAIMSQPPLSNSSLAIIKQLHALEPIQ